jgi:hypothetical protein
MQRLVEEHDYDYIAPIFFSLITAKLSDTIKTFGKTPA